MHYQCAQCDQKYPREHVSAWGKSRESDGQGNTPCCVALVKDHLGSNMRCGGALIALAGDAEPAALAAVTAI